jgi:DNA-binding MarR family transcriptional regulator
MNESIKPDDIDPVIHERVRLAIVSALAVAPEMSFNELKSTLGLSDGNLSAHATSLQQAGYIEIEKTFKGRRPHTTMRLTPLGQKAFAKYLETLQKIIEKGGQTMDGTR